MIEPIELHITAEKECSVAELTSDQDLLQAKHILQCIDNGAAWITQKNKTNRFYDPDLIINSGEELHIYCNEFTLKPCPFEALLISDQQDFSIWFKPSGMLSQGSKFGSHWSIHRWIEQHVFQHRTCHISHRLDRFTQGLMIVAHNKKTNTKLHRLFEHREIQKTYRAVVNGLFPTGECVEINSQINHQDAETMITGLNENIAKNQSLLSITPRTGRKHQVRRHLSYIGHSVINDRQYGQPPFKGDLMLQAAELDFNHPTTGEALHFSAPEEFLLKLKEPLD
ncbi:MAG: RluA family pseudouridine synthase [Gammaproteobacteria bacterium]|nr:RluA family pseudouridine synthase [Gammaproteobacteria bacterium]